MSENEIAEQIIGCAIKVHRSLGPGLLESAYVECLHYELVRNDLNVEKQKPLVYEEVKLECGYRADLLVENKVIIEVNGKKRHKAGCKQTIKLRGPLRLLCVLRG